MDAVVVINGVPYTYMTTYAKREFHGTAIPTAYGSFNFNISWKGLTLATLFTYQLGGKVMDGVYSSLMSISGTAPSNLHKDLLGAWRAEDATADHTVNPNGIPVINGSPLLGKSLSANLNSTSSRWLTSASYLILKNINLSYQLPKNLVRKIDLDGITLTATCENLFTKTARKGMNPQQSFSGSQVNYLVTPRVFSFGVNVKF
jgi:hypothetical protein